MALSNDEFIRGMYRSILDRTPDSEGLKYWTTVLSNGLHTQMSALKSFVNMPEAQSKARKTLERAYREVLGREPDTDGMNWYMSQVNSGQLYPSFDGFKNNMMQSAEWLASGRTESDIGTPYTPPATNASNDETGEGTGNTDTDAGTGTGVSAVVGESSNDSVNYATDPNRNVSFEIGNVLERYGLGAMTSWVEAQIKNSASDDEIMIKLYDHETFKARFPARELMTANGFAPMSPAEYIDYENNAISIMRAAGLPSSFYDSPGDFTNLIANNISPVELRDRVNEVYVRAVMAPDAVKARFASWYGVNGEAAYAAMILDPDTALPLLERQLTTAEIAGTGDIFGTNIDQQRADRLAALGFNGGSSMRGFQQVADQGALFDESITESQDLKAEEEGVDAAFGLDADAKSTIERRRGSRVGNLSGGGGLQLNQEGIAGRADN